MKEVNIEKYLKDQVEKRGGKALKFISPGMRGVPDRIVLLPGAQAVFVELKAPDEKLEPLQIKRVAELEDLDFKVYCLDTIQKVDKFIQEVFYRV
ncbi:MAG: VRR-NUC domain-containing protein [Peptococcaceae bacterium]|nr:VRR-NUC domain-containing protein [Peptococcaceae bacterium]